MKNIRSFSMQAFGQVSGLAVLTALAASGAYAQDVPATGSAASGDVVVVTGMRASARSNVSLKRNASEVVDSITAEDIGKLPDNNVSETLTRIPGVQGYRYAGEGASPGGSGSGVTIRGLSGQTASQINSRVYFTAGNREFNVESAIPAMIAGIDVYKNPSAEHIEGGIGGLVNIRTRNPSDFKRLTVSLGATLRYNDLENGSDPEVFGLVANKWDLADGGRIGFLAAAVTSASTGRSDNNPANGGANFKRAIRADSAEYLTTAGANHAYDGRSDTWFLASLPSTGVNQPNLTGLTADQISNVMVGTALTNNQFQETIYRTRKGLSLAADYRVNDALRFYADYNYTYYQYHQNYRGLNSVDNQTVQGLTTSPFEYTEGLANRNSNGGSDDVLVSKRLAGATFLNSTLTSVSGDEHTPYTTWTAAGGVEWSPTARLSLKADVMYIKADRTVDNRSINMVSGAGKTWTIVRGVDGAPHTFDIVGSSLADPANWVLKDYQNGNHSVWDDNGHAIALSGKYELDGVLKAIKFGFRNAHQESTFKNFNVSAKPLTTNGVALAGDFSNAIYGTSMQDLFITAPGNFMRGKAGYPGGFLAVDSDALLGDNIRNRFGLAGIPADASLPEAVASRRFVEEDTNAVYLMGEFELFDAKLKGNVGVRYVTTDGHAIAGLPSTGLSQTTSYSNTLPSLNATYYFAPDFLLRFGYGKGLTRPGLDQLNPSLTYSTTSGTGGAGNPNLRPQLADSYDLSLERYFSSTNYLSAALFQKDIDSFFYGIATCETIAGAPAPTPVTPTGCPSPQYLITRTINAEPGWVKGIELAGQYFFDDLEGIWSHFGVSGSYTYVDTALPVNFGTAAVPRFVVLPQPMQSKHNYSLSGIYEDSKLSARVVYTWRSDAILFGAATNPIDGRYIKAYGVLDASLNYKINEQLTLSLNALNLTDSALNRNVGEPGGYETDVERQHFLNGRNYNISLRYKFGG